MINISKFLSVLAHWLVSIGIILLITTVLRKEYTLLAPCILISLGVIGIIGSVLTYKTEERKK